MAKSGNRKNLTVLLTGLLLSLLLNTQLFAQKEEPFVLSDTSYFKTGDDNWNLVESVIRREPASVLMLLKRGGDPNSKAEGGMTALMYAVENGDSTIVNLLVLNGA